MPQVATTYEVVPGDTLGQIAQNFGITLPDLLEANQQIDNPDLILVGQIINIPDTGSPIVIAPVPGLATIFDGMHPAPGTISTSRANYVHPPLANLPGQRNPAIYSQVVNQFAVGNNPRYLAGGGKTYCNIFVWDVTRAMGAEIPHWIDNAGNIAMPGAPHANEITINGGVVWMQNHGVPQHNWQTATDLEAQNAANHGLIAVVMWKNPTGGHGHTAVVRPGSISSKGPSTAQAGAHNFNMGHVEDGFGHLSALQYFFHD